MTNTGEALRQQSQPLSLLIDLHYNGSITSFAKANEVSLTLASRWLKQKRQCVKLANGRWVVSNGVAKFIDAKVAIDPSVQQCLFSELVASVKNQLQCDELKIVFELFGEKQTTMFNWLRDERMCYRVTDSIWFINKRYNILIAGASEGQATIPPTRLLGSD